MLSPINLSPRNPAIDAANLPELVEAYVVDARLRVKPGTAATYDLMLSYLLEWWGEAGPEVGYCLGENAWRLFEGWLARRPSHQDGKIISYSTRNSCLSRCRQMLKWAYAMGFLDRDFSGQVPNARGHLEQRSGPDADGLQRLMIAAGQERRPIRAQAIVAVFIGTGMRRAEAAGLCVEDVIFHADGGGLVYIRKAKLDKPRRVVFDSVCGEYIAALLDDEKLTSGPLFTSQRGGHMAPESVYQVVKKAMRRAGIDERGRGPHDLRRAFATEWVRHRRDLGSGQLLSMQLGHTTQAMSLHYARQNLDDLQEGFVSPLSKMSDDKLTTL